MTMKTIDDATPEEWNELRKTGWTSKQGVKEPLDDAENEHPRFSEKAMVSQYDAVSNPAHYNTGSLECIEAIEAMLTPDEYIGYLRGNALKYMWRFRYKDKPIEDLRKARWYEERLIKYMLENASVK